MRMIEQTIEIVFNKGIVTDTFLMGLRSPEIAGTANPGQFVMIRAGTGIDPLLRRPFSICGTQGDDLFFILFRVVGRGTAIMAELKEGERLSVLGPLGRGFELPKKDQLGLLIAGGIGVAPLFYLAQTMKKSDFKFMAGFRSANEIIRMEQICGLPIDVSIATDDGTEGYAGQVTDLLENDLRQQGPEKDSISVFACGPRPMLKKVATMAMDHGVYCQTSLETAMACGIGACQGCVVNASSNEKRTYYHVCTDGPVFPVQDIDWNALSEANV